VSTDMIDKTFYREMYQETCQCGILFKSLYINILHIPPFQREIFFGQKNQQLVKSLKPAIKSRFSRGHLRTGHHRQGLLNDVDSSPWLVRIFTQMPAPLTRARNTLENAQNVSRNVAEVGAF